MEKQPHQKPIKASIVILDFLKSKRVLENVESLEKQVANFPFEIIIVDNSCNKDNANKINTLRKFENVKIHINEKNSGYIVGNNKGAMLAKGEFLLIVNPDIIWPKKDVLEKLVEYMEEHAEVGICGPKQIDDSSNSVTMSVRAFPNVFLQIARRTFLRRLPIIKDWVAYDEMQHLDYNKIQEVDWLQSSFWITRKSLWDKLGGLDKSYFLFMSDPDLCAKVWKAGYKVVYNPEIVVHADGRRVSEGGFLSFFKKWTMRQHLKDSLIYEWKHFMNKNPRKSPKR